MTLPSQFKLIDSKPDQDFIKWNEAMSRNFDQDWYYKHSNLFIVWVEKLRLRAIVSLVKKYLGKNIINNPLIVEVGCGAGHVLKEISENVKTNNLIGVDPLENWLEIAREKVGGRAKLIDGFVEDLPFQDKTVDVAICTEVLEHVIDPKVALLELKRVVKDEGLLVVSIPNEGLISKLKNLIDLVKLYDFFFYRVVKHNDWHLHDFDLKSFKNVIPESLEVKSVKIIPNFLLPLRYVLVLGPKKVNC